MPLILNAVLLRALPARRPATAGKPSNPEYHGIGVGDGSGKRGMYAYSEFLDLLAKNQVFSSMLAVDSYVRRTDITVEGARSDELEHPDVTMVSGDYFRVLGIRPFPKQHPLAMAQQHGISRLEAMELSSTLLHVQGPWSRSPQQ